MPDSDVSNVEALPSRPPTSPHPLPTGELEAAMEGRISTTLMTRVEDYERAKREAKAKEAREAKDKYDQLLDLSVAEGEERVKGQKLRNKLLGALVAISGVALTWVLAFKPAEPKPSVMPSDVKASVEAAATKGGTRLDKVETIQKAAVEAILDQQVQIDESFQLLGDKVDAADKRSAAIRADAVDENGKRLYPAVMQAKKRADKIKEARGESLLHDEIDVLLGVDARP